MEYFIAGLIVSIGFTGFVGFKAWQEIETLRRQLESYFEK